MSLRTATASRPNGVYRTRGQFVGIVAGTLFAAGAITLAVLPGKGQIAGWIFVVPLTYLAYRAWLFGVRVRDDGIVIGAFLSSRKVSWSEIERFTCEPSGPYPFVGRLIRSDGGRPLIMSGIDAGRRPTKKSRIDAQATIDLLNAELARHRGTPAPD
jgi:hypothetical protein